MKQPSTLNRQKKITGSVAIGTVSAMLLVACSNGAEEPTQASTSDEQTSSEIPEKPDSLTINTFSGVFADNLQEFVVDPFEEETGITVNVVSSAPPLATLAAQGDNPEIDLFIAGDPQRFIAQEQGLLQPYDPENVPNADEVYEQARRSETSIVMNFTSQGLLYDTNKIDTPPTSWFDLFDLDLPNQVVVRAPDAQNTVSWLSIMAKELNGDWPTEISDYDEVLERVETDLKPNLLAAADNAGDLASYVYSQQAALAVHQDNQMIIANEDHGASVAFAAPEEGVLAIATMVSLTNTPNKYWAEKLMDKMLDAEAQAGWAVNGYYGPSNMNTDVPEDIADQITYGPEDIDQLIDFPWEQIIPLTDELVELFNQAIAN